jgi:Zn-dependent protease
LLQSALTTADVDSVRPGVRLQLLGIPIRFDPSLLILLLVVATSSHAPAATLVAFVCGAAIALIAHELGHALVSRHLGASDVNISLHAWGGLTRYRLRSSSRGQIALIAVAGPAVGLALGVVVWLVRSASPPPTGSVATDVYRQLLFVTVGWSLINLLPVIPLDGGRLLEQLLPGSAQNRTRTAAVVSVVVAAIACHGFWQHGYRYAAVMFAVLAAYGAIQVIVGVAPGNSHRHTDSCDVFRKASAGDYAGAQALAQNASKLHPSLKALTSAVTTGDQNAIDQLWRCYEEKPDDEMARSCVALWRTHLRDWPGILSMLQGGRLKIGACTAAFLGAYRAGAFEEAASIGEAMLRAKPNAAVAYNTACCWSRAGNTELALRALMRAAESGWGDWHRVDQDRDLQPVRDLPAYQAWRLTYPTGDSAGTARLQSR